MEEGAWRERRDAPVDGDPLAPPTAETLPRSLGPHRSVTVVGGCGCHWRPSARTSLAVGGGVLVTHWVHTRANEKTTPDHKRRRKTFPLVRGHLRHLMAVVENPQGCR